MAPPKKRPSQRKRPQQGKRPAQGKSAGQAKASSQTKTSAQDKSSNPGTETSSGKSTRGVSSSPSPSAEQKESSQSRARAGAATAESARESTKAAEERRIKREASRQERLNAAKRRQQQKRRKQILIAGVVLVALLAITAFVVQRNTSRRQQAAQAARAAGCGPVQTFALEGRDHLPNQNATFNDYKTNPPTSGSHHPQAAPWGSYQESVPKETLVHNLEHGGIVIHHKGLPPAQVDELNDLVDSYRDGVVSNPNDTIDRPIVIASWTRMQKCDRFSEAAIEAYIAEWCNKGPEKLTTCRK
ncbi:MAG: DUF3105 domain-containing protein [Actinomycetota bacterium]|nr:DUF3105 domain-containing protein [Actinomycetota bacterium]